VTGQDTEPSQLGGDLAFEETDFDALAGGRAKDPEWTGARLEARRRLLTLAKAFAKRSKALGTPLDVRTSLHHPHAFNGMAVRRLWAYITRTKAEKTGLRKVLGRDLAKDLNSAYRNAYLCLAIEPDRLEVSLRIHVDAWYDGQHLINRVKAEGLASWLEILNQLDGFQLRLHDWRGEWPLGSLTPEQLEEFLRHYTPGEHQLVVDRRWPVPPVGGRAPVLGEDVPGVLLAELERLLPLYRYTVWTPGSEHLFSSSV